MLRIASLVVVVIVGCKSAPKQPEDRGSAAVVSSDAAADAPTAVKPARTAPTKDQLASFRQHMKTAWAAQKAKRWADAVRELEAALAILDDDPRALGELGWSAMNAGDLVKARKADEAAVRLAVDNKVKAAGLYNLGLVQLQLGDKDRALESFLASLQLRPNKTVEQQVAKLGATPASEPPFCGAGKTPCFCVETDALGEIEKEDPDACAESKDTKSPVAAFHVYAVKTPFGVLEYLLDEHDQLVTIVAGDDEHSRHVAVTKLAKAEIKTVGGHRVLWLETTGTDSIQSMSETAVEDEVVDERAVTICAIGDGKTATRCAVRDAPLSRKHTISRSPMSDDGTLGRGTEKVTETAVEVSLADDGTVSVKLTKGSVDNIGANVVGTHHLW